MSAPNASNNAENLLRSQTELEMREGRRQVERRAARPGRLPENANGATGLHGGEAVGPTGIVMGPGGLTGHLAGPAGELGGADPQRVLGAEQAQVEQQIQRRAGSNGSQAKQSAGRPSDEIASFMARVVPWPSNGQSGVINLHWTSAKGPGMRGRAFLSLAQWGATKPDGVDGDL
jgi:hypothetical protein